MIEEIKEYEEKYTKRVVFLNKAVKNLKEDQKFNNLPVGKSIHDIQHQIDVIESNLDVYDDFLNDLSKIKNNLQS